MRLMVLAAVAAATMGLMLSSVSQAGGDLSATANQKFLATNAAKPGVTVRPSGLQYRVIKSGHGRTPGPADTVQVYYRGTLIDGELFDKTEAPQKPAEFQPDGVIPGWTEALLMMKEGDEWELVIPSNLAYGERGAGAVVPPNQTLVFDVTLLKVK